MEKYWQDEMEENELLEKRKIEWMENNLYNIAPYEYLPAEKICDTMLGYPKEVISRNYYKKNIFPNCNNKLNTFYIKSTYDLNNLKTFK